MIKRICLALAIGLSLVLASSFMAAAKSADDLSPDVEWKIARLSFEGNRAVSSAELAKAMQTKTRPAYLVWRSLPDFDPDAFKTDIERLKRLYESKGYYHAEIAYDLKTRGDTVDAQVRIREGPQILVSEVEVVVHKRTAPAKVAAIPPLKKGSPFTEAEYQRGESLIRAYFLDRGHGRATAERTAQVDLQRNLARVTYTAEPGPLTYFGKTTIEGTHRIRPYIVARELSYKEGDLFSPKKVAESRKKILALKLFSAAEFKPDLESANPSVLPITVKVTERRPHDVRLGGGYGTQDEFRVQAQWANHNFLGDAREFTLMVQYSTVESIADARMLQRHFPSHDQDLVLDAKLLNETESPFTLVAAQLLPLMQENFSPTLSGLAGFRAELFRVNGLDPTAVQEIGGVRRKGILAGPMAQLTWNTTEDPFNPTQGAITTLNLAQAGGVWGGQADYYKMSGEVRKYTSIGWGTVLANRLEIGFADSLSKGPDGVPIFERFYSGGPGSVRGYGRWDVGPRSARNTPLGGLSGLEGSIELRRAIHGDLAGAIFLDFGDVSLRRYHPPINNLKFGAGPALMYLTPVGPLRFDLGFPFQRPRGDMAWQIYFSVGQYF